LAAISHEIRTPLTAVIGFCDLMGREIFGPVGDPRYTAYVRHIADGGAALLKSTEETLALSALLAEQTERTARTDVRLDDLLADVAADLAPVASARDIRVTLEVAPGLGVHGDVETMRQALTHLSEEAVERAASGGRIAVRAVHAGDQVVVEVVADPAGRIATPTPLGSLAVSIARVLLELDGATLSVDRDTARGVWQATVRFEPAAQADLFHGGGGDGDW
jgi:two-component system cell cycle sensor histidine kinase PleC